MSEEESCHSCGCKFTDQHEGRRAFCDDCGQGPFCRMCLVMRHKPSHSHGWWSRLMRWFGWHRCVMCVEVRR